MYPEIDEFAIRTPKVTTPSPFIVDLTWHYWVFKVDWCTHCTVGLDAPFHANLLRGVLEADDVAKDVVRDAAWLRHREICLERVAFV